MDLAGRSSVWSKVNRVLSKKLRCPNSMVSDFHGKKLSPHRDKEILKNKELSSRRGLKKSRLELQTGFLTTVLQFNQCLYCPYFPAAGGCSWNNEITIQQFFNGGKMHRLREGDRV